MAGEWGVRSKDGTQKKSRVRPKRALMCLDPVPRKAKSTQVEE